MCVCVCVCVWPLLGYSDLRELYVKAGKGFSQKYNGNEEYEVSQQLFHSILDKGSSAKIHTHSLVTYTVVAVLLGAHSRCVCRG